MESIFRPRPLINARDAVEWRRVLGDDFVNEHLQITPDVWQTAGAWDPRAFRATWDRITGPEMLQEEADRVRQAWLDRVVAANMPEAEDG